VIDPVGVIIGVLFGIIGTLAMQYYYREKIMK
jgi:hypothetical protein